MDGLGLSMNVQFLASGSQHPASHWFEFIWVVRPPPRPCLADTHRKEFSTLLVRSR